MGLGELFPVNITGIKTHNDQNLVSFKPFAENSYFYDYRPFDLRFINYDLKKVVRHRYSVMQHMLQNNICLIIPRQAVTNNWNHAQVSKHLSDNRIQYSNKGIPIICPLYLYSETNTPNPKRKPNLNDTILNQIAEKLNLEFECEKSSKWGSCASTFSPIDLIDYVYAILYSATYREKYKEHLKILLFQQ